MADVVSAAINAVPPVTRTLLAATTLITLPCLLALASPSIVALSWHRVFRNFEIWRPFTAFFFAGGGFPALYDFFLLYRNSSTLERDVFFGDVANYTWTNIVMALFILTLNIIIGFPFLFRPLLYAQTYLWCRSNPTMKVSIFGLLTIPTSLYPPVLVLLDVLTGGPMKALSGVMGIVSGHAWWFFSTYLPLHAPAHLKRPNPFSTPSRFRALFPRQSTRISGSTDYGGVRIQPSAQASARSAAADAVRHRWGGGQRLGGDSL